MNHSILNKKEGFFIKASICFKRYNNQQTPELIIERDE